MDIHKLSASIFGIFILVLTIFEIYTYKKGNKEITRNRIIFWVFYILAGVFYTITSIGFVIKDILAIL